MKTKHIFTKEEFEIIVKTLEDTLGFYYNPEIPIYYSIECEDDFGNGRSMSLETFINNLKDRLNIED